MVVDDPRIGDRDETGYEVGRDGPAASFQIHRLHAIAGEFASADGYSGSDAGFGTVVVREYRSAIVGTCVARDDRFGNVVNELRVRDRQRLPGILGVEDEPPAASRLTVTNGDRIEHKTLR